ncbi:MAG: hypothetical protein A4E28_00002 [Methanocella sp. PtaU1.Bin125]|nr:MAG: hypothetical protein A4E28_00002 [Methanocella sp. PtaU1.Bin125]
MRISLVMLGLVLLVMMSGSVDAQVPSISPEQQANIDQATDMMFDVLIALNALLLVATLIGLFRSMRISRRSRR